MIEAVISETASSQTREAPEPGSWRDAGNLEHVGWLQARDEEERALANAWHEKDDVVYFTVTSDGKSGAAWLRHYEERGMGFRGSYSDLTEIAILGRKFRPTSGVTTTIAVLKASSFPRYENTINHVHAKAAALGLKKPAMEIGCLIRDKFTNAEIRAMGLESLRVMHKPVAVTPPSHWADRREKNISLGINTRYEWLHMYDSDSDISDGYAFAVPQPLHLRILHAIKALVRIP